MNILYISNGINLGTFKYKYGFSCSYNNLRALAIDNKITLVCFADFDKKEIANMNALNNICREVILVKRKRYSRLSHRMLRIKCFLRNELIMFYKNHSLEMRSKIKDLERLGRFDIAIYDGYGLVQYAKCIKRIPKIFYLMDSLTLREQENLKSSTLKIIDRLELLRLMNQIKDFEKNDYNGFSRYIVVAERDRDMILGLNPKLDIRTVPFCVDTEYFKNRSPEDNNTLIFTGISWTEHNADAVFYFCNDVLPLIKERNRNISLLLMGGAARKEIQRIIDREPCIKSLGFVEDTRPYLDRATVFISPMRIGSGLNNKLLEAMSMGKAIVTTEHGNRGIGLRDGREAMVCKDKLDFADAVTKLLKDEEMRRFLGANARKKAEQDFSIEAYSSRLQEAISGIVSYKKNAHGLS